MAIVISAAVPTQLGAIFPPVSSVSNPTQIVNVATVTMLTGDADYIVIQANGKTLATVKVN